MEDQDLLSFVEWYVNYHGNAPTSKSIFATCICGHFHTFPRIAKEIVKRLAALGRIEIKKDIVSFNAPCGA